MHLDTEFEGTKADIFSLGATLFKLVTRNNPFNLAKDDDKFYTLIKSHKYDDYWKKLKFLKM